MAAQDDGRALTIIYRNWRGDVSERKIVPQNIGEENGTFTHGPLWFGVSDYHGQQPCWHLHALDTLRGEVRDFKLTDIIQIK